MINKIKYIISSETNPYQNLALEEYLLKNVGENECILYLWQNEKTVVIGKNQNPWKECRITELNLDGGRLARRLSGGGAVFHDLGNLNFTFLVRKEDYSVDRQLSVILEAVRFLGIPAEKTGRNDISVEGRKFSGNAFFSDGIHCYHHGTLLVHVDMSMLSHYLNVSREKLVSKGVESVRSRVVNLTELKSNLTIDFMKQKLIEAFGLIYHLEPEQMKQSELNLAELKQLEARYSSWQWLYGRKIEFNYEISRRFSWGDIDIKLEINEGLIRDCVIYSDSLETELFEQIMHVIKNHPFSSEAMTEALKSIPVSEATSLIISDIIGLIREENL